MSGAGLETGWAIAGLHGLSWHDLLGLWGHYLMLSMLAVGGAITTAPDMQRYLVAQQGWLSDAQFTASVALAQAAPGPNILFVALLGWNVGGAAGLLATMSGVLLPSSLLAVQAGRYGRRRADALWLRAFTAGLTPLTLGLLLATGWVLAAPGGARWGTWLLVAGTVLASLRSRINPVWLIALGGAAGLLGWV
jgi:chromate transporter